MVKRVFILLLIGIIFLTGGKAYKNEIVLLKFIPLRTVLKTESETPLYAEIKAVKEIKEISIHLNLPEGITLLKGKLKNKWKMINAGETLSLKWVLKFNSSGFYQITLRVWSDNSSIEKRIDLDVKDRYWVENAFLLSAFILPMHTVVLPIKAQFLSITKMQVLVICCG